MKKEVNIIVILIIIIIGTIPAVMATPDTYSGEHELNSAMMFIAQRHHLDTYSNEQELNTTDNLTMAQKIATEQNKNIFLVITSYSCSWCDKLEEDTLTDEEIISKLDEEYVTAIINVEEQPQVAQAFNAVGTPIMILMDSNGTEFERLDGYYGPEELIMYL